MSWARFVLRGAAAAALASCAVPAFAQQQVSQSPHTSENTVLTPEQLRRIDPPSQSATLQDLEKRGDELRADKAFADAIDYYKVALSKATVERAAVLHNKLGMSELMMMRLGDAKKDFERSIKLNKAYSDAVNNLGVVYYETGNFGKAIKYYSKAIKLEDDSASFHSNLGTAYFAKKDFQRAVIEYAKALELDPDIFERHSRAGVAARMSSPQDRARYEYVLAKMFAQRNDPERCLRYLQKSMEDGFKAKEQVMQDAEFAGIKKDPRFVEWMKGNTIPGQKDTHDD
jgi:tetratricopeptide (TPR) repeat protein